MTLLFTLALACGGGAADTDTEITTEVEDTGTPWPDSPCEGLTDEDGDGWCAESGDCDDNNPLANPDRGEDPEDGFDNDCDGRVDEEFKGVVVVQVGDGATIPHRVIGVDTLGRSTFSVDLDNMEIAPYFLTAGVNEGWAIIDLANLLLVSVDSSGHVETLADLSWAENGAYGLTTHPDGYYVVGGATAVVAVDPVTGEQSTLAEWDIEADGLFAFDVVINPSNKEIGVYGLYGGFATISTAGAFEIVRATDFEAEPQYMFYSGDYKDQVGWFASGWDADGFGIFELDAVNKSWTRRLSWADDWDPHFVAVDSDSGDYYLTTEGGQYPYVWKLDAETENADIFYPESGEITPSVSFWDLYSVY